MTDKTKLLIIGTSQLRKSRLKEKVQVRVCGKPVEESKSEKLLGLVLNNQEEVQHDHPGIVLLKFGLLSGSGREFLGAGYN